MLAPPDRREEQVAYLARIKRGERVQAFETVRVRKNGTHIQISLTVSPVFDGDGRVVGAAGIGRDITGRKPAEDELRRREEELRFSARTRRRSSRPTAIHQSAVSAAH